MTSSAPDVAAPLRSGTAYGPNQARGRSRVPPPSWFNLLPPLRISLSILLLVLVETSRAQLDPVKNFCRRFGHQTAVIDRRLYIDGGFINYSPLAQYPTNYTNTGLHYHELDTPNPTGLMPQLYANLTKNSTIPSVHGGTLWADNVNKRFYLFGGEYYLQPPPPDFILWSFDAIYEDWESFGSPAQSIDAASYGAGTAVSERGEGYYYGGWKSNNTVPGWTGPPVAISGLVRYSMDSNSWANHTGPDSIGRAEGAMVFLPIGDGGMLVYFGGVQDPHSNGSVVGQPMETIFLFDVLSSKWYTQNATGTVPQMRRRFCAGATWAPDQSSYNIYLYGGAGMPPDTSGFDDVYVLTIPSFQWIKMYPTDGNATGEFPHHSLSCNVIDNSQMIIIGGTFPTSDRCDVPEQFGVHNVDMGKQNPEKALWQIFEKNLTTYSLPDDIVSAVGGSAGGGATKLAPDAGFSNPDLRVLMTRKASLPERTPTRSIPTSTGSPENTNPLSTGAIAGIAVAGAVVAVAAILGIIWCIRRRRRRRGHDPNKAHHLHPANNPASPNSLHAQSPPSYTPDSGYPYSPFLREETQRQQEQYGHGYPSPTRRPIELPVEDSSYYKHSAAAPPLQPPPAVAGLRFWLGPDGVTYALVTGPHAAAAGSTTVANSGGTGTGTGTSTTTESGTGVSSGGGEVVPPLTKIDAEGRVWVQVSPGGGGESPGGFGHAHGHGHGHGYARGGYHHHAAGEGHSPPVSPGNRGSSGSPPGLGLSSQRPLSPQELSTEPARERGDSDEYFVLGEGAGWDAAHGRPKHATFYHP